LAKPNYNYQKKQKELARQAKQAAKRERRQGKLDESAPADPTESTPPKEDLQPASCRKPRIQVAASAP
jgi:hypothetical protein